MTINFKEVELQNFLSFDDATITLADNGYVLVSGINQNLTDAATSNGSGKSSIWEAIIWALTGETIRGTKDVVNMHSTDGTYVQLVFDIDNTHYTVLRSKDHKKYKTNLKIYINGEDKSGKGIRDSTKLFAEYLPDLTASLIGSVILLGQGLPQRFSSNTPSGRKEILEKLSKSDFMIEDLKIKINTRRTIVFNQIRAFEDTLLSLGTKVSILTQQTNQASERLNNMPDNSKLKSDIAVYEQNVAKIVADSQQHNIALANSQNKLDTAKQKLWALDTKYSDAVKAITDAYNEERGPILDERQQLSNKLFVLASEIKKLKQIVDICPTCGQKLPDVHRPDTTQQEAMHSELSEKLAAINTSLDQLAACEDAKKQALRDAIKTEKSQLTQEVSTLETEVKRLKNMISVEEQCQQVEQDKLYKAKLQLEQFSTTINELNAVINNNNTQLAQLHSDILYNTNEKENIEQHGAVLNKFNTIITRDFRGYLLTNVIQFIDSKAKEYSKEVFDNDRINFLLNGNNIDILYDDKPYENLSGGEKQKIDLIVQFSIRDMLCKFLNFSSNILVLDEIFDNLDAVGCQKVIDLISRKLKDINSIYIITHHTDIQIPYDKELVVVKNQNGVSRIRQ